MICSVIIMRCLISHTSMANLAEFGPFNDECERKMHTLFDPYGDTR
jgi:hypothetical protein